MLILAYNSFFRNIFFLNFIQLHLLYLIKSYPTKCATFINNLDNFEMWLKWYELIAYLVLCAYDLFIRICMFVTIQLIRWHFWTCARGNINTPLLYLFVWSQQEQEQKQQQQQSPHINEWFICFPYEHVINFNVEQVASIKYKPQMDIVNVIDILPILALSKNKSRHYLDLDTYESHMLFLLSVDVLIDRGMF